MNFGVVLNRIFPCGLVAGLALAFLSACEPPPEQQAPGSPPASPAGAQPAGSPLATVVSQADLAKRFESAGEIVFQATTAEELASIKAANLVNLTPADGGLNIVAKGNDASVLLPPFAAGRQVIVQVNVVSPAATFMQLFYGLQAQPGYDEKRSQLARLEKGRNTVYFMLDQPTMVDPLRLDPGMVAGEYLIESIVAKSISPGNPAASPAATP